MFWLTKRFKKCKTHAVKEVVEITFAGILGTDPKNMGSKYVYIYQNSQTNFQI